MIKLDCSFTVRAWFSALLISTLAAGCGGGGGQSAAAMPVAPTVIPVAPLANATEVKTNTQTIVAAFSKAMNPATLTSASFSLACPAGTPVTGVVSFVATGNVATLTFPSTSLPPNTICTVTVTAASTDTSGMSLAGNFVWSFTTGASTDTTAPTVSSTVPLANATGVPINTVITAIFGEPMDPPSITNNSFNLSCPTGTPIVGTVGYGITGSVATFTPTAGSLPSNTTCAANIGTSVRDVEGNHLVSAVTWTFTTAAAVSFCAQPFIQTDHFVAGTSINGQNGWGQSAGFSEQVQNIGTDAYAGQNVWLLSNQIASSGYDNQPMSPRMFESGGESTVRSNWGGDSMEVVFWLKPVSSVADGSAVTISLSPSNADRMTYFRLINNLDANGGFQIVVIDYPDVAVTGNYRTFVTPTHIDRTTWIKVRMVLEMPDGPTNDVFQFWLNDQLAGTYSSWEDYHTWPLGGNSVTEAVDRVLFRVSGTASGVDPRFVDASAQGYYFDNYCQRIYNRANPSTTLQFYQTGFEP